MRFSFSLRFSAPLFSALLLAGCSALPSSSISSEPGLTLSLIHINDTHSQFDASPASVKDAAGKPVYTYIGGHPRLLTQAQQLRLQASQDGVPALFLHGGDAFKGSAYFELFEQRINIDVLNRMNIDAMALGNHEFDIGLSKLADFVDKVNFPVLAANVDTSAEPLLVNSQNLKPYSLFALDNNQLKAVADVDAAAGRELVAVFGLALQDMRAIAPDTGAIVFNNEVQSAQQTVDRLTAQGVKHIIALTHLGNQRDLALAGAVNGIDAIVGGHSHSLLGDFRHWYLGNQRPYAELVANPDGKGKTCVVQAGQFAQAVGQATLKFNAGGELLSCAGQNTLLAGTDYFRSALRNEPSRIAAAEQAATERYIAGLPRTAIVTEDAALRSVLHSTYLPAVQQAYGAVISSSDSEVAHVRLPGSGGSDKHGSALAGHIADAMLNYVNQTAVQNLMKRPVQLALIGAGNIRAPLPAGEVREGNIRLEVLPFDTPLSVLSISGAELRALLTDIISQSVVTGAHTGKFPYVAGIRYVAKQTGPATAELTTLDIKQDGGWQAVEPQQRYSLVTTSYLADGNDGWQLLQRLQAEHSDRLDIILRQQQVALYPVKRVTAIQDSTGQQSFTTQYHNVAALPCKTDGVDCKVAAQAFIEYLRTNPALWQQQREPTVTLVR
ncbi:MAG: bifunctional metallophosphatase/5'-nucleotidase [Gammaproteobacteria bacterium]|nr:bifunctional metallophosphatase/5'-nucleotidase [Gammaproteobacteria bacterium]MBU1555966.1 bifunctional metallophosphatase/5'-nucleotidase [Gammaproteobacteria bacterium]MBU2070237.1 bifunctional metallophosphatase/5'-nucleotidase [Gammaproteobacteria bacterium]MBU2182276.1 bifunctional metallophosphatase/5'-nucleotidase [Gammaproteobacteria bacterium]MBU2206744.1 bifunctional metallophosphatase/5'-nucleotidase [Gammaproteobacteria bacterium]